MNDFTSQPSPDFIFGTLATDEIRLARMRAERGSINHGYRLVPADPLPGQPVTVLASTGPQLVAERVTCYYTTDGSDPQGSRGVARCGTAAELTRTYVEWDTLLWGYVTQWAGQIPGQPSGTLVRYRIEAWSDYGPSHWASEVTSVEVGKPPLGATHADLVPFNVPGDQQIWSVRRPGNYAYHVDEYTIPDWLRDTVIYQIFVDRFAPDGGAPFKQPDALTGHFGGTLHGIAERLDYLADLGVNCLWLTPIFQSPSHHGYDATDYTRVESRFGTLADLRMLIEAAHARDIRVLLDLAANHVHREHPIFQAAQADQTAPEAAWFSFTDWPEQYQSFFGVRDMPQINTDHPAAAAHLIDSARFWLAQGVDGFRLDYAIGPSHAFWSQFRAATRAVAPGSVTFGEVTEAPTLQHSYVGRMDGCLDFALMQALRQLFAFGTLGPAAFDTFLRQHLAFFGDSLVLPSFLDNHDMNRFLWVVGGDMRCLRLAALCQFTLPHPPIIYYGTEVGLSQQSDVRTPGDAGGLEQSRLPMLWAAAQDQDLLRYYRALIRLRRTVPELWRGARSTLVADDSTGLYVYRCAAGDQAAIVALNTGPNTQVLDLPRMSGSRLALASDATVTLNGRMLHLGALAGAVIWEVL
ncbi:MAG TPA: alpha-amylase family glycosyl hydrolase [Kouleothrix sp.]|nr:alpha-amylase family glycosyl hydrolase [Kouleothrix sp.]